MAEKFLKMKEEEIIIALNETNEFGNVNKFSIETFYGPSAGRNAVGRINDISNRIDLVITDLNMEDGFSGCTVIQEIVKRDPKIPVYVVSEFFRNEAVTCKTLQESENGIVDVFKNCCGLPNIIGISKNSKGKLEINEISSLFKKLIVYRKNIQQGVKIERILGQTTMDSQKGKLFPSLSKAERVLGFNSSVDDRITILPSLSKADRVLGRNSSVVQSTLVPSRPTTSKAEHLLGYKYMVEDEPSVLVPSRPTASKAERVLGIVDDEQNSTVSTTSPLFRRIRINGATRSGGRRRKCIKKCKTVKKSRRKTKKM
jgi:CheY-like chemotaxis protein